MELHEIVLEGRSTQDAYILTSFLEHKDNNSLSDRGHILHIYGVVIL